MSSATPLIQKLTKALSASTPHLVDDDVSISSSSSFENLENEDFEPSVSASLSSSTPNLSPACATRQSSICKVYKHSLDSPISEEDGEFNTTSESIDPTMDHSSKKIQSSIKPVAQARKKSNEKARSDRNETPPIPPRVINISGPTNVCLPASVDLTSPIYKPIQRYSSASDRSDSKSPNRLAFMDPFITESSNRESSPFSRFIPQLPDRAVANYDRTRNFMRRNLKSPTFSSFRQSTRSLTSSALQSLRKSSRNLKSSLMSLTRAASMEAIDIPALPGARASALNISAPCIPRPVETFAYCPPSSIENVKLKSTQNKTKFSSLHKISKKERTDLNSATLFKPNSKTSTPEPSLPEETVPQLKSFKTFGGLDQNKRKKPSRKISLPDFHRSLGSLNGPYGQKDIIQPAVSLDSLNDLYVFSDAEVDEITSSIGRSLTSQPTRPKLATVEESQDSQESTIRINPRNRSNAVGNMPAEMKTGGNKTIQLDEGTAKHPMPTPVRKKKSTKAKAKDPPQLSNEKTKLSANSLPVKVLPTENQAPMPAIFSDKENAVDGEAQQKLSRRASFGSPMKSKLIVGMPIDERQAELQQKLLQCLKVKLDEYNIKGTVSPLPSPLFSVNLAPSPKQQPNDKNENLIGPSQNLVSDVSHGKEFRGKNNAKNEHKNDIDMQERKTQRENERQRIATVQAECHRREVKEKLVDIQEKRLQKNAVKSTMNEVVDFSEQVDQEVYNAEETSDPIVFEAKNLRIIESLNEEELLRGSKQQQQEDGQNLSVSESAELENYSEQEPKKMEETLEHSMVQSVKEPDQWNLQELEEWKNMKATELRNIKEKGKHLANKLEEQKALSNEDDDKKKELEKLIELKNRSLQLLKEKQERELALRREKEELDRNQKLLEETLQLKDLERKCAITLQNHKPSDREATKNTEAKHLYLKKLLEAELEKENEQKEELRQHELRQEQLRKELETQLKQQAISIQKIKSSQSEEEKLSVELDKRDGKSKEKDVISNSDAEGKVENPKASQNIRKQLMYHLEQRKLQQQMKLPKPQVTLDHKTGANSAINSKEGETQDIVPKKPVWDEDDGTEAVNTNISDFIGCELVRETEGYVDDEQPTSLTLLPPPENFSDAFLNGDYNDEFNVESTRDDAEIVSNDHVIVASSPAATRPSLKKRKSKLTKKVTFGDADTEINYYPKERAEEEEPEDEKDSQPHSDFNSFTLKRQKFKRNCTSESSASVNQFHEKADSDCLYENLSTKKPSDHYCKNAPPLPAKKNRVTNSTHKGPSPVAPPTLETAGVFRRRDVQESRPGEGDESFA
ncbi:rootletin-like [Hyalella azteca]|uniref:Rootletin-like n=1 Tax=Hyalella azteca TaxID=294128 RepID=A0A8B7P091_HYAAZ|nr:rootletin-like [Hyalella azteca]